MFGYGHYYNNNLGFGHTPHSKTKLQDQPNMDFFFLQKDLKLDHKMIFHFTQFSNGASFLPREVVKSIPFSSDKVTLSLPHPSKFKSVYFENIASFCPHSITKSSIRYGDETPISVS